MRHRRGGRQPGHPDQARPVRDRVVLRLRQHLPDLPGRLPEPVRPRPAVGAEGAQAELAARPAGGRHPGGDPGPPARRPDPQPARRLGRAGHRLVRRRRRRGGTGQDGGGRRRRRGRAAGVLAARQLGAERIIAMSRHAPRQQLAREFGATDIVTERGDAGRGADQGTHRRAGRALDHRGRRHPGVDAAGNPRHPARRACRLCRCLPRRRAARRGAVLRGSPSARRPGPGAPLPARPDRPDLEPARSIPARSSTWNCRWPRWRRATARWTSAGRSRRCCVP